MKNGVSTNYENEQADGINYTYVVLDLNQTATIDLYFNSTLRGDVDRNCRVDVLDLARVGKCFGQAPAGNCTAADLSSDGVINIIDLATVGQNFGSSC